MKTFHYLVLIGAACAVAGCPRREPTLDEAIDALPDEWGIYSEKFERFARKAGTTVLNRESSTNNYAMLNKVISLTNAQERIRLTWKLYNHFRRTPEWLVEHREAKTRNRHRHAFLRNCSWELRTSPNSTPETIIEGRKMDAETIRDLAEVLKLTEPEWPDRGQRRHEAKEFTRYEEFMSRLKEHHRQMYSDLAPRQMSEIESVMQPCGVKLK